MCARGLIQSFVDKELGQIISIKQVGEANILTLIQR